MRLINKKLRREIIRRKEGIIIGMMVGAIASYFTLKQGQDLSTIYLAGKGFVDGVIGRSSSPYELAAYKLYAVFMFVGGLVGGVIDKYLPKR